MHAYIRIFALLLTISVWSQDTESPLSLTLKEAITYGLENNYSSINARREVAKAIQQKWETTATGLPQINGQVDYTNRFKQLVTLIPGEVAGGQPGSLVPVVFGVQHTANVGVSLNQLIFDGSYLVGLKAAKAFMEFNENNEEKIRLEVRRGIINAYGAALLSDENISILENNVKNVEKNLLETEKIYENGLAEEEDVEQLKITLAQLKNQLENGYRLQNIAYQMFNLAIGIEIDAPVKLIDQLEHLATESINPQFNTTSFDPQ
ncbi:MAG: TolC family protein, partial [Flavobacteriaceae bacterium]|nr:TolC family protein [Flavobacteriaceae bacterium]